MTSQHKEFASWEVHIITHVHLFYKREMALHQVGQSPSNTFISGTVYSYILNVRHTLKAPLVGDSMAVCVGASIPHSVGVHMWACVNIRV